MIEEWFFSLFKIWLYKYFGDWNKTAWFVYSDNSWFKRGAVYNQGSGAGVFGFGHEGGHPVAWNSFRVVSLYYDNLCLK